MTDNPSTPVVAPGAKGDLQDPSPLVREMMQREVTHLQSLFASEIKATRTEIITRLDGMDKALAKVEQYPTDVDLAIKRLREFFEAEFRAVEIRFAERDKRFDLRDEAGRELLREQRSSAAEAIRKSDDTTKQLLEALDRSLRDLKERLDTADGKTAGGVALWGFIVAAIVAVGVLVGIVATLMTRVPAA